MKMIIMKKNDWKGNYKSIYSTLGASNHSDYERAENDFYSTDPEAIDYLLKYATEFVLKALELSERKVAMFLKVQFLESRKRWDKLFKYYPPSTIYVFVKRINCYRNDDRSIKNSAVCYSWFVWDKEYNGETKVKWINNF